MEIWTCCNCDHVMYKYPSNGICPKCGNEEDFEEGVSTK